MLCSACFVPCVGRYTPHRHTRHTLAHYAHGYLLPVWLVRGARSACVASPCSRQSPCRVGLLALCLGLRGQSRSVGVCSACPVALGQSTSEGLPMLVIGSPRKTAYDLLLLALSAAVTILLIFC